MISEALLSDSWTEQQVTIVDIHTNGGGLYAYLVQSLARQDRNESVHRGVHDGSVHAYLDQIPANKTAIRV